MEAVGLGGALTLTVPSPPFLRRVLLEGTRVTMALTNRPLCANLGGALKNYSEFFGQVCRVAPLFFH